ncbi:ROK family protein [Nocardia sp. NPDC051832]|uniref:ROK family protein n=1 Tax=Nocardia sp. NPDC051832 TaxID=3155673 RepID=UPI00343EA04C
MNPVTAQAPTVLALEIGSARFASCRISVDDGMAEVVQRPAPTSSPWMTCEELMLEAAGTEPIAAVGICAAGPIDMADGVVAAPGIPEWRTGFGIVKAVGKLFGSAPALLAVDGVCFGLAERHFGVARDAMDALTIDVSDRVVGGLMVGGFVVVGRTGNAGQIGHVRVSGFDEACECGNRGCLQAIAAAPALVRWAGEQGWAGNSLAALITSAEAGDQVAVAALGRAGAALGRAIVAAATLLDVDTVVVRGTVASGGAALWQPLIAAIGAEPKLSYLPGLRARASDLGDVAGLMGAGVLAFTALGAIAQASESLKRIE